MAWAVVTASPLPFLIVVETFGVFGLMTTGSLAHPLLTGPVLFGSPLKAAENYKIPALSLHDALPIWATPLVTVLIAGVRSMPVPWQVLLSNRVYVIVPPAFAVAPVIVAES